VIRAFILMGVRPRELRLFEMRERGRASGVSPDSNRWTSGRSGSVALSQPQWSEVRGIRGYSPRLESCPVLARSFAIVMHEVRHHRSECALTAVLWCSTLRCNKRQNRLERLSRRRTMWLRPTPGLRDVTRRSGQFARVDVGRLAAVERTLSSDHHRAVGSKRPKRRLCCRATMTAR
jgi:hypothetical protein